MSTHEFEIEFNIKSNEFEIDLEAVVKEVYPDLEDLEVTPSGEDQNFTGAYRNVKVNRVETDDLNIIPSKEDQSFKGLFGNINVEGIVTEQLNITPKEEAQNFEGLYDEITVQGIQTEEVTPNINFSNADQIEVTPTTGKYIKKATLNKDTNLIPENIKEGVSIFGVNGNMTGGSGGTEDEFKITNCAYLFYASARTTQINEILKHCKDFSNMNYMFGNCQSLLSEDIDFSLLDFSNVTTMQYAFDKCYDLETIDLSYFKNNIVELFYNAFRNCSALKKLDLSGLEMDKADVLTNMFSNCTNLTELRGFKNLGKGYTEKTRNYSSYTLNLSACTKLTYESLMNVINNLYDLNLTYDVANGGTLYRQSLVLGVTNLAKLTEEEIAIATNKGWDVS